MPKSVYIHIPFCLKKCNYCAFVSYPKIELEDSYFQALINEIKNLYKGEKIKTLYFGGGTPSLLKISNVNQIINLFNYEKNPEITLEFNPDDCDKDYLYRLHELGINRISIGSQTFNDEILKIIGRRHSSKQTIETVELAQKVGFSNVSIDLMYGLPEQTENKLKKDFEFIKNLGIQHVSTYGLKIEPNTKFYKELPNNLPDDDMQADFYILIKNFLEDNNFFQYEISNFSLKGFESKHNLNYWNCENYYGFGVSAHGYCDDTRYSNTNNLKEYIENPFINKIYKSLSLKEKIEEEIFLGFRKADGIDVNKINKKYSIDFEKEYGNIISKYLGEYIIKTKDGYKLSTEGFLLSNIILADFL